MLIIQKLTFRQTANRPQFQIYIAYEYRIWDVAVAMPEMIFLCSF